VQICAVSQWSALCRLVAGCRFVVAFCRQMTAWHSAGRMPALQQAAAAAAQTAWPHTFEQLLAAQQCSTFSEHTAAAPPYGHGMSGPPYFVGR
jgi:hypothetical protein